MVGFAYQKVSSPTTLTIFFFFFSLGELEPIYVQKATSVSLPREGWQSEESLFLLA